MLMTGACCFLHSYTTHVVANNDASGIPPVRGLVICRNYFDVSTFTLGSSCVCFLIMHTLHTVYTLTPVYVTRVKSGNCMALYIEPSGSVTDVIHTHHSRTFCLSVGIGLCV